MLALESASRFGTKKARIGFSSFHGKKLMNSLQFSGQ